MIQDALGVRGRGFDIHVFDGIRFAIISKGVRLRSRLEEHIHRIDHRGIRPSVYIHPMDVIDIRRRLEIREYISLSKAVDRLLRITDVEQDLLHAEDAVKDVILILVRILEFVDEHRVELGTQPAAQAFGMHGHAMFILLAAEGFGQLKDHVIEGDHTPGGLLPLQRHIHHGIGRTGDQIRQSFTELFQLNIQLNGLMNPVK